MKKLIGKFTLEYLDGKNEYVLRLTPRCARRVDFN